MGHRIVQHGPCFVRFRSVMGEETVEQHDVGSELSHLRILRVVEALGGRDQQPEHQCYCRRDQSHPQPHGIPGLRTEMVFRQTGVDEGAKQRAAKYAREYDEADGGRTHGQTLRFYRMLKRSFVGL